MPKLPGGRARCIVAALAIHLAACSPAIAGGNDTPTGRFPPGFLWGVTVGGFQGEMGGGPPTEDAGSDWWTWVHDAANIAAGRVSGDLPEAGPSFWENYGRDITRARGKLRVNSIRMPIEWSRIFPNPTTGVPLQGGITLAMLQQLDVLADRAAVDHYRAVLAAARLRQVEPFVTLNHFTLPRWLHDAVAIRNALAGVAPGAPLPPGLVRSGWLDPATIAEFAKYAAYVAWKLGDLIDLWVPINEPTAVAFNGYLGGLGLERGSFPPGAFNVRATQAALANLARAHAVAYRVVKAWDTADANGDGDPARVGPAEAAFAFTPASATPRDAVGTFHAVYVMLGIFLEAVVKGQIDVNFDGAIGVGERDNLLAGTADFIGIGYDRRARVVGVAPMPVAPLLDFVLLGRYATAGNPSAPVCPYYCSEIGWETHAPGLYDTIALAGRYGLPVYVTENGIADEADLSRPTYILHHLLAVDQAIGDGRADVRGYFHRALTDGYEWTEGYGAHFGLSRVSGLTKRRVWRRSALYLGRVARRNRFPPRLVE